MNGINCFARFVCVWVVLGFFCKPGWSQQSTDFTSFKPGQVWPADDGMHIDCHGGNIFYLAQSKTYYWFGEYRGTSRGFACYSSKDLYNWNNEGLAFDAAAEGVADDILERPKVVYNAKTDRYVLWFHHDTAGYSFARAGVAVSDSIKGPYHFIESFRPNGHESRDMGLFVDDDGRAYDIYAAEGDLQTGANYNMRISLLSDDYLKATAADSLIARDRREAPAMFKFQGTYYLITSGCSGWSPNQANYYTATNIMGPYTRIGDPCVGDSSHITFNSQSTFVLPVQGYSNAFIYMGDRWSGGGHSDSRHIFLPITLVPDGTIEIRWLAEWDLGVFSSLAITNQPGGDKKNGRHAGIAFPHAGSASDLLGRSRKDVAGQYGSGPSSVQLIVKQGEKRIHGKR